MDKSRFDELKQTLRKVSAALIMDGIVSRDTDKLALGNTLSIALAAIDMGGDIKMELMMALNPLAERLKDEVTKRHPDVKVKMSTMSDDEFPDLKEFSSRMQDKEAGKINIADLLTGTGVFTAKESKS